MRYVHGMNKLYPHWCIREFKMVTEDFNTGHAHPRVTKGGARRGASAAHRFPSTTSMRSSAVESLRRVTSALWILYSDRMLFTVSPSSSVCAHWSERAERGVTTQLKSSQ